MARLSVVVPTLDEAERLPRLLDDLAALGGLVDEVVVADGGSTDATRRVARDAGARVVVSAPGRGIQLREGARAAGAPWLLFIHADCRMPAQAGAALRDFLAEATERDFAHFRFALEANGAFARTIELGQRVRERVLGLVYGDQGLVVSAELYRRVGGHPEWALMEDVGVIDRLEETGRRVALQAALPTSARRYAREGGVRAWLRNVQLITRFRLGAPPERLAGRYSPERAPGRDAVAVFAKPPLPGRVKTRLAADVGEAEAVRIYRAIGGETVAALRTGPWRTSIWVSSDEPEALRAVSAWLGVEPGALRSQRGPDLGARMDAALRCELDGARAALVVGTDIPGLRSQTIAGAFEALGGADVVIGPATDGGYYLIGMREPHPELFHGIPWSTDRVLPRTLAIAEEAGLRVALLAPMTDVDTVSDLPAAYRSR